MYLHLSLQPYGMHEPIRSESLVLYRTAQTNELVQNNAHHHNSHSRTKSSNSTRRSTLLTPYVTSLLRSCSSVNLLWPTTRVLCKLEPFASPLLRCSHLSLPSSCPNASLNESCHLRECKSASRLRSSTAKSRVGSLVYRVGSSC